MNEIPKSHPRYLSLITRNKISEGLQKGLVHETGLIAHGRGEAFDYLIGEKTQGFALKAEKIAAAILICAKNPVISINGNVAILAAEDCIKLANSVPAKIEVNLFHKSDLRKKKIIDYLLSKGAKKVYGENASEKIPNLNQNRAYCERDGIFTSDVVLVPLEDGDRCHALKKMNKTVITIDLNPLSRTSQCANVTIVNNLVRAIPNITNLIIKMKKINKSDLETMIKNWNNLSNLNETTDFISKRLNLLFR
jgi:4-phosphopantoate--beta-alanine ligase